MKKPHQFKNVFHQYLNKNMILSPSLVPSQVYQPYLSISVQQELIWALPNGNYLTKKLNKTNLATSIATTIKEDQVKINQEQF